MKNREEIEEYIKSFDNVSVDKPFGEDFSVYHIAPDPDNSHFFALIKNNSNPLQISLKSDQLLAEKMRQDYDTIMPAQNLNKKYWNTIICTGQVPEDELKSLITISYNLANH